MSSSGVRVFNGGKSAFTGGVASAKSFGVAPTFSPGRRHVRHHFRGGRRVVVVGAPYDYSSYAYDECLVPQRVLTNWGYRTVLVNVCEDEY